MPKKTKAKVGPLPQVVCTSCHMSQLKRAVQGPCIHCGGGHFREPSSEAMPFSPRPPHGSPLGFRTGF